jgi:hypothetical protein
MASTPFDSIESAQEYVHLLAREAEDVRTTIQEDIADAIHAKKERHLDALRLVDYKLMQLAGHLGGCRRILNDLRILRRLLVVERDVDDSASPSADRRAHSALE